MDFKALADQYATQHGVDPGLFRALVRQESGWNPTAKSPVGAYGLTQAMPATAADPGFGVKPLVDIDNPEEQLRFGAEYLSKMIDRYDGDVNKALAAYNWGAGNADKWSGDLSALPAETRGYIQNITGGGGSDSLAGGEEGDNLANAGLEDGARAAKESLINQDRSRTVGDYKFEEEPYERSTQDLIGQALVGIGTMFATQDPGKGILATQGAVELDRKRHLNEQARKEKRARYAFEDARDEDEIAYERARDAMRDERQAVADSRAAWTHAQRVAEAERAEEERELAEETKRINEASPLYGLKGKDADRVRLLLRLGYSIEEIKADLAAGADGGGL
jgi:hypothetical protein